MENTGPRKLSQAVNLFCQYIENLPPGALEDQAWGPREVLVHLVFHHERYVILAEACLHGVPCEPLSGKYRQINAAAVAMNRDQAVEALVARFKQANRRLAEIYQNNDPGSIRVEIKTGVKVRSLTELLPEVEAHIRIHLVKLKKTG